MLSPEQFLRGLLARSSRLAESCHSVSGPKLRSGAGTLRTAGSEIPGRFTLLIPVTNRARSFHLSSQSRGHAKPAPRTPKPKLVALGRARAIRSARRAGITSGEAGACC